MLPGVGGTLEMGASNSKSLSLDSTLGEIQLIGEVQRSVLGLRGRGQSHVWGRQHCFQAIWTTHKLQQPIKIAQVLKVSLERASEPRAGPLCFRLQNPRLGSCSRRLKAVQ